MNRYRSLLGGLCLALAAPLAAQTDISGTWSGMLPVDANTRLEIHFVFTRGADGSYAAILTSPDPNGIQDIPATRANFDGSRLVLVVDALAGRYEGVLENGTFTGNWQQQNTSIPLNLAPFVERVLTADDKAALRGSWVGKLSVPQANVVLTIVLRFEDAAGGDFVGFLDSPDQGANGIPIASIELVDGALKLTIPRLQGEYMATLAGDRMTAGTFSQVGQGMPLEMARGEYRAEGIALSAEAMTRLAGSWVGRIRNAAGAEMSIVFRFERGDDGGLLAYLDSPEQGATGIPMSEISVEGDSLSLVVPAAQASFRATLSDAGMTGTWAQGNASQPLVMAKGEYVPSVAALELSAAAMQRLAGAWRGEMGPLEIVIRFETAPGGEPVAFLDVPTQGVSGLAVAAASLDGDALTLSIQAIATTVSGTVTGNEFDAVWQQGQASNPLKLVRAP